MVGHIEAGRRGVVGVLELAGLCWALETPLMELLAGQDQVDLPSGGTAGLGELRDALQSGGRKVAIAGPRAAGVHDDETRRAARKLQVAPWIVERVALEVWGRSLAAQRDRCIGDLTGVSPRSAQARRGHVTRALVEDLATPVKAFTEQHVARLRELREGKTG